MSKKDKERKDAEKQKKEAKKLKAEKAVEAVKEKAARKKAELDDLLGEIPTVHTDELQKYAEKHEKMAESDDKAEDEILTTVSTEKAPAAIGPRFPVRFRPDPDQCQDRRDRRGGYPDPGKTCHEEYRQDPEKGRYLL